MLFTQPDKHTFPINKLILVGQSGVGKSSFLARYCHNKFLETQKTTLGIQYGSKRIQHLGKVFRLNIYDTGGQQRYRSIARSYYKDTDVVIGIYDLCNPSSINQLINFWFPEVRNSVKQSTIYLLFGTKQDLLLEKTSEQLELHYQSIEEYIKKGKESNAFDFYQQFRGSNKDPNNTGIKNMMDTLLQLLYKKSVYEQKSQISKITNSSSMTNNNERNQKYDQRSKKKQSSLIIQKSVQPFNGSIKLNNKSSKKKEKGGCCGGSSNNTKSKK